MNEEITEAADPQERLQEILLRYVEAVETGATPTRQSLVSAHPEFAIEIGEFLASYQALNRMAVPLRGSEVRRANVEALSSILRNDSESKKTRLTEPSNNFKEASAPGELGQLGDYKLLREIGRGGMGIVYEAEQISLRRRVAIKILPFVGGADSRQLQRFRNEAEAAAHLHHSHIVPVFAIGCERGVHYYAMQYIEGQSLAALIADLSGQDQPAKPEPQVLPNAPASLSTQVALTTEHSECRKKFFQTVASIGQHTAEALEYAHQMGVVHRDIKPANLLIDGRGKVWITDFGLAQFQNQVGLTMTGELLGTLRYASPEQVLAKRGLIDHHTDIYSLGATLYELMTLKPVFDGRDRHALLQQVGYAEPMPPRSLDPSIPFELETIVLKALAKNPADRYGNSQDLADDLQRFLEDKPIQAKRPTLLDRARKWMRRHPAIVGAAMVLLLVCVVGFAVSTALIAREQSLTQKAYDQERTRAREAEQRFQLARRSADEMIELAQEEMSDHPTIQNLRRRLLESALAYYEEFIELRHEDVTAQTELATTRDRVKNILADLAVLQGAGQHHLLKQHAVLSDMKVSKDQWTRCGELLRKWDKERQETFGGFHRLDPEEKQRRFVEMARSNEAALAEILRPEQLRRFRQIALQCKGRMAFREPEVISALKLTTDQKKQILTIETSLLDENLNFDRPFGPPWSSHRKEHEEKRANVMKQILKLLTREQATQWTELTGDPFTSAEPIFLPPGPPREGFMPRKTPPMPQRPKTPPPA